MVGHITFWTTDSQWRTGSCDIHQDSKPGNIAVSAVSFIFEGAESMMNQESAYHNGMEEDVYLYS